MFRGSFVFPVRDESAAAAEFIRLYEQRALKLARDDLDRPDLIFPEDILAVHYADGGAQGEAGAVQLLCCAENGVKIYYGNYVYGKLSLNAVIEKLPMLASLDSRYSMTPPYPFGGRIDVPDGWSFLYMGAMNYLYARDEVAKITKDYIPTVAKSCGGWVAFDAIAWFLGVQLQ